MIAFVLSGGGNRGPVQVGALTALTERGIRADVVTGTSAGALNGMAYCALPNLDGLAKLATVWKNTKRDDVWPGGPLTWAWRALTGKLGLVSYRHLLAYVEKQMDFIFGRHDLVYGDLQIPLFVTAVDVERRWPHVSGGRGDADAPLAVTVTASAAMPFVSEPVPYSGALLTDGGVANPLPIDIAVLEGATEIYAIDLSGDDTPYRPRNILEAAVAYFDSQQNELAAGGVRDALRHNVTLHHLKIGFNAPLLDFDHAREMIERGYRVTREYLDNPRPLRMRRI